jgi:hypothetical protein
MQSPEPLPAHILMTVIDPAHARYRQAGALVFVGGEDADGRALEFELQFSNGERVVFTAAQVRLVRGG